MHVPFIINQNRYNIFDRTVETNGLKETSQRLGLGLVTFSPLDQGLLTDRYLDGVIPSDSRIATDGRFLHSDALTEDKLKQIHDLNNIAAMRGQTLAEMALAWLLHDDAVTSVLVGASKPEQLLANLKALENTEFTDRELSVIRFITTGLIRASPQSEHATAIGAVSDGLGLRFKRGDRRSPDASIRTRLSPALLRHGSAHGDQ